MWSYSEIIARGNNVKKYLIEYVGFIIMNVPEKFIVRLVNQFCNCWSIGFVTTSLYTTAYSDS